MKQTSKLIWRWFRTSFTKNLGMKVGAFIFAFLLWCYVVTENNPIRVRTLNDVPVTYVGADSLRNSHLTPAMPFYDYLNTVDVTVQVRSEYLQSTTSDLLQATVDLSGITEPGEYTLPIRATSVAEFINITGAMPSNVTVNIEQSVDKQVPVEVQLEGTQNPDLYYGVPRLSQSTITLYGPRSGIEEVARAICTVDINGLTQVTTATHTLTLVDQNGEEIPSTLFSSVPSVIVEVPIYPMREITIDTERIRDQIVNVPEGYDIQEVTVDPPTVELAGPQEAIDAVTALGVGSLDLENATQDTTFEDVHLILPEQVYTAIPDTVTVKVTLAERQAEKSYSGVTVAVKNLEEGLQATLQPSAVDVTVGGSENEVSQITASSVRPFVDVAGLGAGTHTVPIKFESEPDLGVTMEPSVQSVQVTIRAG